MWDYIAGNLSYTIPYALVYLMGVVVAAINIRRAGVASFMVMGSCTILLVSLIVGQLIQAYFYSIQDYSSIGSRAIHYIRFFIDMIATVLLIFAAFVGRRRG